ncbi:MAG: tRNA pseudouridine(54/55) synthase Pus10 [Candidatus Bipolaricaulota bacterium]|nr:MAG: tRNA pseudouridine(54/55) synthase Pus10 [Candidatus Bipolaricaulota bacterium]
MLARARQIVLAGPICDDCLGRAFGMVGHGIANHERGERLRAETEAGGARGLAGTCWVCGGLFDEIDRWAERALAACAGHEFATYLFGVRLSPRLEVMEETFVRRFPSDAIEPLGRAINRGMGKAFERLAGRGTVSFDRPDLSFVIDLFRDDVAVRVASVFLLGRYRKLIRGVPQTHWPCRTCRGRGCETCGGSGKQYPESVEELVAAEPLRESRAERAHLHGAGREDVDARMLGAGRPFVLELVAPRQRAMDLEALTKSINASTGGKVEVEGLEAACKGDVARIKEARARKRYRALVRFAEPISEAALGQAMEQIVGGIEQRTPARVSHRRADLVRRRQVLKASVTRTSATEAELDLETEGGLYIKELVSGDDGRTRPSLAGLLGVASHVEELDVLEVLLPPAVPLERGEGSRKVSR